MTEAVVTDAHDAYAITTESYRKIVEEQAVKIDFLRKALVTCKADWLKSMLDNKQLRAALEEIASGKYSGIVLLSHPPQDPAVNRARAALGGENDRTISALQTTAETLHEVDRQNAVIRAKNDRLLAALSSIAKNTCCGGCGEAALVARAALREKEP